MAARRVGVTIEEYKRRVGSGEKWCVLHRAFHPVPEFAADGSRYDGLTSSCRAARNEAGRVKYVPRARPKPGRSFVPPRDGDARQARRRINFFVEAGLMPPPNAMPCVDCGHVWRPRERRHEYDHYLGYAAAHHEHVHPVCTRCHHRRERERQR